MLQSLDSKHSPLSLAASPFDPIIISFSSKCSSDRTQTRLRQEQICVPYYPAKEGLARLTTAEVTERESGAGVASGVRGGGGFCCSARKKNSQQTHYSEAEKHPAQTVRLCASVCVLRLCHFALLIYETLQVP